LKTQAVRAVEKLLQRRHALELEEASAAQLAARLRALRDWQAARLADTYADLRRDPRYRAATEFFLTDLYGAHDFEARDRQLAQAWRFFRRWLPPAALRALGHALELDVLTRELDQAMAARLQDAVLSNATYARAFVALGRRTARERQIELVASVGNDLQQVVGHGPIGMLLKAAHVPAHAAGLGDLQGFLERGYRAFRAMPSADEFLATIRARETAQMNRWFSGASP
jgi:hypothetical protein